MYKPPKVPVFNCQQAPLDIPIQELGDFRQAFAYVTIARVLNGAWRFWKQIFCNGSKVINI